MYRKGYTSPVNPFVPAGWIGSCKFPQITAGGLQDAGQHGKDLLGIYRELLGFLPAPESDEWRNTVVFRVTNNLITSEVAGMVIGGMGAAIPVSLVVEVSSPFCVASLSRTMPVQHI